jgi:hypothetical protein
MSRAHRSGLVVWVVVAVLAGVAAGAGAQSKCQALRYEAAGAAARAKAVCWAHRRDGELLHEGRRRFCTGGPSLDLSGCVPPDFLDYPFASVCQPSGSCTIPTP